MNLSKTTRQYLNISAQVKKAVLNWAEACSAETLSKLSGHEARVWLSKSAVYSTTRHDTSRWDYMFLKNPYAETDSFVFESRIAEVKDDAMIIGVKVFSKDKLRIKVRSCENGMDNTIRVKDFYGLWDALTYASTTVGAKDSECEYKLYLAR